MGNKKTWEVKTEVQRGYIGGDFSNNLHFFTKYKQILLSILIKSIIPVFSLPPATKRAGVIRKQILFL
jgi:hypothetical protein